VTALLALLLGLAAPPTAYVSTGATHVPLAISSWCWGNRCGAPIAASTRTAVVSRGATVRVELKFEPRQAHVAVAGTRALVSTRGSEVSWRASRSGGLTVSVTGAQGWITYVGRLSVR
jgi:hypothetical protein